MHCINTLLVTQQHLPMDETFKEILTPHEKMWKHFLSVLEAHAAGEAWDETS